MHDMEDLLSLEIKREIADRYFGFRKMIEEDSLLYDQHIRDAYRQMENDIGFDLIRLYILLGRESLIREFRGLTGLNDQVFFDAYLLQSTRLRQRLFARQPCRGFTRRGRFHNLFLDIYARLDQGMDAYRATLARLVREADSLEDEIEVFHRKNDLGAMMGFLRGLDSAAAREVGGMAGGLSPQRDQYFEDKMRIRPPAKAEELLPPAPTMLPLKNCKNRLKGLIDDAFEAQGQPEVLDWGRPAAP